MKCIHCDAETEVLYTRFGETCELQRRRMCHGPVEHRFTTAEVPVGEALKRRARIERLIEKLEKEIEP